MSTAFTFDSIHLNSPYTLVNLLHPNFPYLLTFKKFNRLFNIYSFTFI